MPKAGSSIRAQTWQGLLCRRVLNSKQQCFPSLSAAAESVEVTVSRMRAVLGSGKMLKGCEWDYTPKQDDIAEATHYSLVVSKVMTESQFVEVGAKLPKGGGSEYGEGSRLSERPVPSKIAVSEETNISNTGSNIQVKHNLDDMATRNFYYFQYPGLQAREDEYVKGKLLTFQEFWEKFFDKKENRDKAEADSHKIFSPVFEKKREKAALQTDELEWRRDLLRNCHGSIDLTAAENASTLPADPRVHGITTGIAAALFRDGCSTGMAVTKRREEDCERKARAVNADVAFLENRLRLGEICRYQSWVVRSMFAADAAGDEAGRDGRAEGDGKLEARSFPWRKRRFVDFGSSLGGSVSKGEEMGEDRAGPIIKRTKVTKNEAYAKCCGGDARAGQGAQEGQAGNGNMNGAAGLAAWGSWSIGKRRMSSTHEQARDVASCLEATLSRNCDDELLESHEEAVRAVTKKASLPSGDEDKRCRMMRYVRELLRYFWAARLVLDTQELKEIVKTIQSHMPDIEGHIAQLDKGAVGSGANGRSEGSGASQAKTPTQEQGQGGSAWARRKQQEHLAAFLHLHDLILAARKQVEGTERA